MKSYLSKNMDKNSSPNKASPTKNQQNNSRYVDSGHANNGQIMTQISAIYSKRSRSILN